MGRHGPDIQELLSEGGRHGPSLLEPLSEGAGRALVPWSPCLSGEAQPGLQESLSEGGHPFSWGAASLARKPGLTGDVLTTHSLHVHDGTGSRGADAHWTRTHLEGLEESPQE